jgi:hypothetical protein
VGIITIPPPIPKRPAKTPEKVPRTRYKKISNNSILPSTTSK